MLLTATLLVAMAGVAAPRIDRLTGVRAGDQRPVSVLLIDRDLGPDEAISLYRPPPSGEGGWLARPEVQDGERLSATWADEPACGGLSAFALGVERIGLPRIELVPPPSVPRPDMGPLHVRHALWLRATDERGAPAEVTLASLGSGPGSRVAAAAESLADCWAERSPDR